MNSSFVTVNGVRLHVVTQGDPGNPPIVLLHGFPEFWYSWRHLMPALAERFYVIAPDLRGYNLSDKPVGIENYTMRMLSADVVALIQSVSSTPVTLVGHDWGGAIAWVVAAFQPNLLSRLVILNAPHPSTFTRDILSNLHQQRASHYMLRFRRSDAEEVFGRNGFAELQSSMGVRDSWKAEEIAEYQKAWAQPGAFTAMLNYYRAMSIAPPDPPQVVAGPIPDVRIQVPTTVIWGEKDHALLPSLLDGLAEYVPNLTIHRIANATHWVQHDAPQQVLQYI